ncbi:S41 family peptidase [Aquimarina sp. AU474]|uniref:S41 family peptidase n=1 Tax=Aquimarina sp. AU474 TaxID=2108529 RepID=UPI000D699787|nr:S41 family peptidase [Aquimarina sp. AU474]
MKYCFKIIIVLVISTFLCCVACSKDDDVALPTTNNTLQQKVFQEFWDIYDRHYPLFHRKDINWKEIYDVYYTQIDKTTTDQDLLDIFKDIMNNVIKDGHTDVVYNNQQEAVFEPQFNENIQNMVQNNTGSKVNIVASSVNNPYISYGTLKNDTTIGYVNAKNFEPVNENDSEFNNFKSIVDETLVALKNKKGIILDVRTNGGGQGPYAYYLAGRFFANSTTTTLIRQRIKTTTGSGVEALGAWATLEFEGYPDSRVEGGYVAGVFPEDNFIKASGTFQYTSKIALLTSRGTASAAEYFTAAMKTQTHVKTIGNITFGIFAGSDIFTLNNGTGKWKTRVSTHDVEVLYNDSFQSFEGIGISPDQLSFPTSTEVNAGEDTHIDLAVTYIKN